MCPALGLGPHQLVARLVTEGIARCRSDDPAVDQVVRLVTKGRQQRRAEIEIAELDKLFESS